MGFRNETLWVKVSAPPVKGKANERLIRILADRLSLPKSKIKILQGETSRNKLVEVEDLTEDEVFRAFRS